MTDVIIIRNAIDHPDTKEVADMVKGWLDTVVCAMGYCTHDMKMPTGATFINEATGATKKHVDDWFTINWIEGGSKDYIAKDATVMTLSIPSVIQMRSVLCGTRFRGDFEYDEYKKVAGWVRRYVQDFVDTGSLYELVELRGYLNEVIEEKEAKADD